MTNQTSSSSNSTTSPAASTVIPKHTISPLTCKADLSLWKWKVETVLTLMGSWDAVNCIPMANSASNALIVSVISEPLLQQVVNLPATDRNAPGLWTHFCNLWQTQDLASKTIALSQLLTYSYAAPTMPENKALALNIIHQLCTAFDKKGQEGKYEWKELVACVLLASVPAQYQSMRSSLEQQLGAGDINVDKLFTALMVEESSQNAKVSSAYQSVASTATKSGKKCVKHSRNSCWTCNPDLRPNCSPCKAAGRKHRHTPTDDGKFCGPNKDSSANSAQAHE